MRKYSNSDTCLYFLRILAVSKKFAGVEDMPPVLKFVMISGMKKKPAPCLTRPHIRSKSA